MPRPIAVRAAMAALGLLSAQSTAVLAQKEGGTLKMYLTTNPPSALPHEETTIEVVQPFAAIYSNLVRFDPTKKSHDPSTIVPELASSWAYDATRTKLTF